MSDIYLQHLRPDWLDVPGLQTTETRTSRHPGPVSELPAGGQSVLQSSGLSGRMETGDLQTSVIRDKASSLMP